MIINNILIIIVIEKNRVQQNFQLFYIVIGFRFEDVMHYSEFQWVSISDSEFQDSIKRSVQSGMVQNRKNRTLLVLFDEVRK